MSGKGETVSYKRFVAKTKQQRDLLKEEIGKVIDTVTTTITIITLVETEQGSEGQGGPGG
jgi:hypothetical protein